MNLVRKQTYLTPDQDRGLKELAERHHTTEAEMLRRAVDHWLALELDRGVDPLAGIIGIVDGPTEINHDDIYA